jgi:hypothetical protein
MTDDYTQSNGLPNVLMNGSTSFDHSNNISNNNNDGSVTSSGQMQPVMSGDKGGESLDGVCRDYMRNVCRRGNNCKFRHPDNFEAEELGKQIEYVFCHDYQVSNKLTTVICSIGSDDVVIRLSEQRMSQSKLPICSRDESRGGALPIHRQTATSCAD